MEAGTKAARAGSLVIELAAHAVIVDGKRVELPPPEFSLLAALAARPGEVIPHKELLELVFPESSWMTAEDLHWRIWKIRKLIGDQDREHKIVGNRRRVGYLVDLPPAAVEVVGGVHETALGEGTQVIRLDAPSEEPGPLSEEQDASSDSGRAPSSGPPKTSSAQPVASMEAGRPRLALGPRTVLVAATVAALLLGGSWLAGYLLSQQTGPGPQDSAQDSGANAAPDSDTTVSGNSKQGAHNGKGSMGNEQGGRAGDSRGGSQSAEGSSITVSSGGNSGTTNQDPTGDSKPTDGKRSKEPPPSAPPQPDVQLYHLYNSDSDDHYMTTSSSAANQKQASGYAMSLEGLVFTVQQKGTVAINLDSTTAYAYREVDSAPEGVTVSALYRLSKDGDFFYTVSSSQANQAEAQGWTRSTAGYVAT